MLVFFFMYQVDYSINNYANVKEKQLNRIQTFCIIQNN